MSERREAVLAAAAVAAPKYRELAMKLHAHPEIGLEEAQAAAWLCAALEADGFAVTRGVADMPTAFVATWGEATAKPVIAILAEYDALPELGHACGHNLIGTAAALAGVALAKTLSPTDLQLRVIGCPAEETYGGKVQLVEHGLFADVDAAIMSHASDEHIGARPASGRKSVVVEYRGKTAHAAGSPEQAVNALDAMILLFNGVSLLRQQLRDEARVHGIITHGGEAANIIPDYTRGEFYVRSFDVTYLEELEQRFIACAQAAAQATGTTVEISSVTLPMQPIRHNSVLEGRYDENVRALGEEVDTTPHVGGAGSTDFGNVSQVVPGVHGYFRIAPKGCGAHTIEFAEASGSEAGLDGMVLGAKTLALTALDLVEDPELLAAARLEFEGEGTAD